MSFAADAATFASMGIGLLGKGVKGTKLALRVHKASIAINAGVGAGRGIQGILEIRDGNTGKAMGHFGEAFLRLIGLSAAAIKRIKLRAPKRIPHGFSTADDFASFGGNLRSGLRRAGFDDVQPVFQGSSVTGKSFQTGQPFDVGRVSDFDVALGSPQLLQRAKQLGIPLRSGGVRTGPLKASDLHKLGLTDVASQLSKQAGRPVNFMIFESAATAATRAPSIPVP